MIFRLNSNAEPLEVATPLDDHDYMDVPDADDQVGITSSTWLRLDYTKPSVFRLSYISILLLRMKRPLYL